MWTSWHSATQITQLEQDQIAYTDGAGPLDNPRDLTTVQPLRGIHTGTGRLLTSEANALLFSGFGFDTESYTVQGIEVQLNTQRLARIQDRTIQLHYQQAQGVNRANLLAEDVQHYGSADDLWGLDQALPWSMPQFGVVVDLQPHVSIPSNNTVLIYSVSLRLNLVSV
jgi:hypothetical protein